MYTATPPSLGAALTSDPQARKPLAAVLAFRYHPNRRRALGTAFILAGLADLLYPGAIARPVFRSRWPCLALRLPDV
ncbi:hypothetical protein LNP74_28075 [Klebsiella pneumoniae subsp. pneumoniae]|nr:hypothetical protein [Klebsiella pneumoniae subsp. pneumoniae]